MTATKWVLVLLIGLMAALVTGAVLSAAYASEGEGHTPVSICHRTSSDTNPYVFITVDDDSLSPGHLDNADPGHKPKFWKTDGTWRGVDHVAGDPKDDYLAQGPEDCEDFPPPPEDIEVSAAASFTDPTCKRGPSFAVVETEGVVYDVDGKARPGETVVITASAEEGYDLVGRAVFTHTFGDRPTDCVDGPTPPEPPKPEPPKPEPPVKPEGSPDLAETGFSGAAAGGIAAALLAAGLGATYLARRRVGV